MKKFLNKNSLVVVLIGFSSLANAQTLQELINVALANNYQIRILKNEAQVAANNNTMGNAGQYQQLVWMVPIPLLLTIPDKSLLMVQLEKEIMLKILM